MLIGITGLIGTDFGNYWALGPRAITAISWKLKKRYSCRPINKIKINRGQTPQLIFAIANYNQKSTKLSAELDRMVLPDNLDVKFSVSSFMGYGLYDEGMKSLKEFRAIVK